MPEPIVIDAMMAKVEVTYGTDPVPVAGTDDLVLANHIWPQIGYADQWENDRDNVVVGGGGSLLPTTPAIPRGRMVDLSFDIEPRPKGSAYSAVGDLRGTTALLRACGLSATVATSGIDFTWVSASLESCTIWFYSGGNLYKLTGCVGRCELQLNAGQQAILHFEMKGKLVTDPATTAVASITYLTNPAPSVVGVAATVGSWSPDFETMVLNFGQEVQTRPNGNQADGLRFRIARHRPRLRLLTESVAIATYDPYADKKARTARTVACTVGSGTGLQIKIAGLTSYVDKAIRHQDLTGFTGYDLDYLVTAGSMRFD